MPAIAVVVVVVVVIVCISQKCSKINVKEME